MKYFLSLVMVLIALTACNTIEGVGEDIRAAGEAIDDSAEKNKRY